MGGDFDELAHLRMLGLDVGRQTFGTKRLGANWPDRADESALETLAHGLPETERLGNGGGEIELSAAGEERG
jgi:hypothetical protein